MRTRLKLTRLSLGVWPVSSRAAELVDLAIDAVAFPGKMVLDRGKASIDQQQSRCFEPSSELLDEPRRIPAINDAVIATDREVHEQRAFDLVPAPNRAFDDLVGPDNGDLGAIDDRRCRDPTKWSE